MAGNESFYAVCTLLYNAIFTVIMEELLFRGYFSGAELADRGEKRQTGLFCHFHSVWILASWIYRYDFMANRNVSC